MGDRARLAVLRRLAAKKQVETKVVHEEVTAKRAARKAAPAPSPALELEPTVPKPESVNSTTVEGWFRQSIRDMYGDGYVFGPRWTVKQRTLAKKLLSGYGPELVERGVAYLVKHWKEMVSQSRGNLSGPPTVNFLWGARERVFGEVQGIDNSLDVKTKPENSDEFRGDSKRNSKIGW